MLVYSELKNEGKSTEYGARNTKSTIETVLFPKLESLTRRMMKRKVH